MTLKTGKEDVQTMHWIIDKIFIHRAVMRRRNTFRTEEECRESCAFTKVTNLYIKYTNTQEDILLKNYRNIENEAGSFQNHPPSLCTVQIRLVYDSVFRKPFSCSMFNLCIALILVPNTRRFWFAKHCSCSFK